jgi:hypothetical protein
MADESDIASEVEQRFRDAALRARKNTHRPKPTGSCRWCSEPFTSGDNRIYCDADCEADAEQYAWQQQNRGVVDA